MKISDGNLVYIKESIVERTIMKVFRPWGHYQMYADNESPCTVKILFVKRGESLSKQFHNIREQMYVILDSGFDIVDGEKTHKNVKPGTIFFHPIGHVHRAMYHGLKSEGRFLDIAFGENKEEDIVRVEDKYGRSEKNT